MKLAFLLTAALVGFSFSICSLKAQSTFTAFLVDKGNKYVAGANVVVYLDSVYVTGGYSDSKGRFTFPLKSGYYDVEADLFGMDQMRWREVFVTGVMYKPGITFTIKQLPDSLIPIVVHLTSHPIEPRVISNEPLYLQSEDLRKLGTRSINAITNCRGGLDHTPVETVSQHVRHHSFQIDAGPERVRPIKGKKNRRQTIASQAP